MSDNPTRVKTGEFRVSYPSVFSPNEFNKNNPKYEVTMLYDKGSNSVKDLLSAAQAAANEKWGTKTGSVLKKIKGTKGWPFHEGDRDKPDVEGYAGKIYVKASSKLRPQVVSLQREPITDESGFYPGCYARAVVTAYTYDNEWGQGVSFSLEGLQFRRDGDPFSSVGRYDAVSEFDDDEDDV